MESSRLPSLRHVLCHTISDVYKRQRIPQRARAVCGIADGKADPDKLRFDTRESTPDLLYDKLLCTHSVRGIEDSAIKG